MSKPPLFAEVHCVPDDYHFTEAELERIIAGDMFTPRQCAIMARELQERRKAASEPVAWTDEVELREVRKAKGEPVAWRSLYYENNGLLTGSKNVLSSWERMGWEIQPLYAAPEALVMPETLPCPVLLEPGLRFGKGVKTKLLFDALKRRVEYYAELDAMTPEQRAEHDAGIAEFKAMLNADGALNNEDTKLDGWIPVSERMPETDGNYWGWWSESKRQGPVWFIKSDLQSQFQSSEITHWMQLPPAPKQENI